MKIRIIVAVLMIGLITQGHSQLQCYVCENCPDGNALTDDMLQSCSGEAGETTVPTTTTVVVPSVTPTGGTTSSSTEPSIVPSTEPPSVPSTEPSTDPSTEPSTEPSIAPSDPPTEPPVTDPTISTISTPEAPITTTPPPAPGTESTFDATDATTPTIPVLPPSTTPQQPETPPVVISGVSWRQTEYNCFVLKKEVNGTLQVNRGCVVASPSENDMCDRANENLSPQDCTTCATNQCNSGSGVIVSVILIVCSIFILVTV